MNFFPTQIGDIVSLRRPSIIMIFLSRSVHPHNPVNFISKSVSSSFTERSKVSRIKGRIEPWLPTWEDSVLIPVSIFTTCQMCCEVKVLWHTSEQSSKPNSFVKHIYKQALKTKNIRKDRNKLKTQDLCVENMSNQSWWLMGEGLNMLNLNFPLWRIM